tara:strand:- start:576 stop:1496 length:921 start_codon:yes stop_codon:yes gene_type:complete
VKEKILILGGNGFIGIHLIRKLRDIGFECFSLSLNKLDKNNKEDKIHYLYADISNFSELTKVIGQNKYDYVVNLSGYVDHSNLSNGGLSVLNTHFGGLLNLLRIIDLDYVKKIVQIGSSDEYGNINSPQNEAMREEPISPYSLGKLACTNLLRMLYVSEKLPIVIVRLFLVYGEGQGFNRFLPQIIKGCLKNEEFPTSEGNQIRDFCYVSDIVDGIIATMKSEQVNGHILNLASGEPIKIKNVIRKVLAIVGSGNPRFGEIKYRSEENLSLYADISKAQKLISWKPKINFDIGLKKTIDYYSKIIK